MTLRPNRDVRWSPRSACSLLLAASLIATACSSQPDLPSDPWQPGKLFNTEERLTPEENSPAESLSSAAGSTPDDPDSEDARTNDAQPAATEPSKEEIEARLNNGDIGASPAESAKVSEPAFPESPTYQPVGDELFTSRIPLDWQLVPSTSGALLTATPRVGDTGSCIELYRDSRRIASSLLPVCVDLYRDALVAHGKVSTLETISFSSLTWAHMKLVTENAPTREQHHYIALTDTGCWTAVVTTRESLAQRDLEIAHQLLSAINFKPDGPFNQSRIRNLGFTLPELPKDWSITWDGASPRLEPPALREDDMLSGRPSVQASWLGRAIVQEQRQREFAAAWATAIHESAIPVASSGSGTPEGNLPTKSATLSWTQSGSLTLAHTEVTRPVSGSASTTTSKVSLKAVLIFGALGCYQIVARDIEGRQCSVLLDTWLRSFSERRPPSPLKGAGNKATPAPAASGTANPPASGSSASESSGGSRTGQGAGR